ncbi:hypothetical protein [Bifidobacterium simiiventris]|uniref:hypothetical protein n=1 Tax=Bifidobacterium simiiventris TaxID=2834434 RepID=UPI001C57572D|nr:hypothetical protein [Bifidobacterium simiiventris]MBW3078769.1 hypothetical protein [Bifidobacterium simiiventris]
MGLFATIEHLFNHQIGRQATIGQPLTLKDAKQVLSVIAVHQPLADMRKVADAVREIQDTTPQYVTFGMSHYYSEPKRVRFQSEGGRFVDADAIATAYAQSAVLIDECDIQHLMGDIADNREHRDPEHTPAVPIEPLVAATRERLDGPIAGRRAWLFALYDQLDDIDEATKHDLAPLAAALSSANGHVSTSNGAVHDATKEMVAGLVVALLFDDQTHSSQASGGDERTVLAAPQTPSTGYMAAVDVFRRHGVAIAPKITLDD